MKRAILWEISYPQDSALFMFQDFASVEHYLNSLINYESRLPLGGSRDRPKLDPTYDALARLRLPLSVSSCFHIAGTKGKGSVVSFLEALCSPDTAVLSFTSPHLVSVKERIRLDGMPLVDDVWCAGFEAIVPRLAAEPEIRLSYFEMTFVFYVWASQHLRTKVHVVEAGLGGRWDATNVLENTLPVITLIDYDHTDILGSTLTQIARDKSGIVKNNSIVVVGRQPEEALAILKASVEESQSRGFYFNEQYRWTDESRDFFSYEDDQGSVPGLSLRVPGRHQRDNAAVAICAARLVDSSLSAAAIRDRLGQCEIPGRQQLLRGEPDVLIDVAHNPISFAALGQTLRDHHANERMAAVVGLMKDKDAKACFAHLQDLVTDLLVVPLDSPRSYDASELGGLLKEMGFGVRVYESRPEAFQALHEQRDFGLRFVTGSFYLVGDYLKWRERAGIA